MKGQMLKLFVVTVAFVLLVGACAAPPPPAPTAAPPSATPIPPTPTPDPAAPVRAWVDALNSGDVDAALALFTDDVTFAVFEYFASDKDGLRGIFDWLAGLETKYQIMECQPKDGGVVCTMPVVDACIAGFGAADGLPTKMEFSFRGDGKISKVTGNLEGGEWDNYFAKWAMPGTSWMQANRTEEFAKTDPWGREAGSIQAKLCREYGASLKATPTAAGATKPAGRQVLLVVGLEQSDDMELMLTKEVAVMVSMLEKAGYEVVVASASGEPITGGTTTLTPDLKLADVKVDDYAGFMFPCLAVDMDLPPPAEAVRIATEAVAQGKPVTAQNGGVVTLSAAGVLNGKQFALLEDPGAYMPGGIYKGTGVVQDGNIITSGTCPYMAKMTGMTDGTPELIQKLIDSLAAGLKSVPTATPMPPTPAPSGDLEKLAMAYQDAFNRRDLDTALALFVDDGLNYMWDGGKTNNKEDVRSALEYMIGLGAKLTIADCSPKGKAFGCTLEWRDDPCAKVQTSLDVARYDLTLVGRDSRIQLLSLMMNSAEFDKFQNEIWPKLRDWAEANRPEEWKKLMAPVVYDLKGRPLGELWAQICKAYLEATKK
jgi:putative intracellular protease/amidase